MSTHGVEAVVVHHHRAHCRTIPSELKDVKEQQPSPFLRLAMPVVHERVDGDGENDRNPYAQLKNILFRFAHVTPILRLQGQ